MWENLRGIDKTEISEEKYTRSNPGGQGMINTSFGKLEKSAEYRELRTMQGIIKINQKDCSKYSLI